MSKAFTRESDESSIEDISAARPSLPCGARNWITSSGAERLKQRLDSLLQKRATTTDQSNQAKLELAIKKLQQILESIVIAQPPPDRQKVAFGAVVVVRDQNDQDESFQIVGIDESMPEKGAISWISPLARALLSRRAGEKVRFRAPDGARELTIVSVDYS